MLGDNVNRLDAWSHTVKMCVKLVDVTTSAFELMLLPLGMVSTGALHIPIYYRYYLS
jgi:hypothetical protein